MIPIEKLEHLEILTLRNLPKKYEAKNSLEYFQLNASTNEKEIRMVENYFSTKFIMHIRCEN